MTDITRIISEIQQGDPDAAERLLPLVYQELRRLAAAKLAQEKPGQTLEATALVHEAYLRLVGTAARPDEPAGGRAPPPAGGSRKADGRPRRLRTNAWRAFAGIAAVISSPPRPRRCAAS